MKKHCYHIANILFLLGIFTIKNVQAEIFAFQNTMTAKLFINNTKGASYLFLNGVYILPGDSKFLGPNWAGTPGVGCNVTYGRCLWNNIGTDIDLAYGAIEAAYYDKTDKGTFGRAGVNVNYNIINGEVRDNHLSVTVSIGYGWSGYSFNIRNYRDTIISSYTQPSFNFEDTWIDVPFVLSVNYPFSQRMEAQPYCKLIYQNNSLYYCVPVIEYVPGIDVYRWNSQEYEQIKESWVLDYGVVVGVNPFNKNSTFKLYTGCSFSKAPDQKENNISFSLGLLKEWGKHYK